MSGASRREQYFQSLKRALAAELSTDCPICPKCGRRWVTPDTAGARLGVCQTCYLKSLAEAERIAAEEIEQQRAYDAARAKKYRARKKARKP